MRCSFDDPFFGSNWEAVFELGERGEAFLDLGFSWAKDRVGEKFPSFILPKLFSIRNRYDVFLNELVSWLKTNDVTAELWTDKLIVVLKALDLRRDSIDDDLFLRGCDGLSALDAVHPLWGPIWVSLCKQRAGSANLTRIGQRWVEPSQSAEAWASVWLRLTDQKNALDILIEPAVTWLSVVRLSHNKWPEVWKRLWDRTGDCRHLGPLAIRWLRHTRSWPKQRVAWQEIWSALWDTKCQQDELRRLKEKNRP